ncbi:MAG TPA: PEP-CTERM sorting domain-containing protein [Rhizomicrobium sp.]|nr:PEP-CTERM sorting domain-containing protein [Rhizomicrobium sp.]
MRISKILAAAAFASLLTAGPANAGFVFLTGHDPDFHSQDDADAAHLLTVGLSYALGGPANFNDNVHKILWVESFTPATSGHRVGEVGLLTIGLTAGQDFDWVDAAGFALADLSQYSAIGVASSFGGMFTSAELNAMIARTADITAFINAGGGLFASAECDIGGGACDASNMAAPHGGMYGYLPVTVSSIAPAPPFFPTAFGTSLGLDFDDLNDPTHNSFGLIGGLTPVDLDSANPQHATTLAGNVTIGGGGFIPTDVPEPATLALFAAGLAGVAGMRRRRKAKSA